MTARLETRARMAPRLALCLAAVLAVALTLLAGAAQARPLRDGAPTAAATAKSCKPIKKQLAKAKRKLARAERAAVRKQARKRVKKLKRKLAKCRRGTRSTPLPSPRAHHPPSSPSDRTPPAAPVLTFGDLSAASASGTAVWLRGGAAGGFTVTAAAADPQSGIRHVSFPHLGAGWEGGATRPKAPYRMSYRFSSAAAAPAQPARVTATNRDGLTSASTFTVRRDASAPQTTIACNGAPCAAAPSAGPVQVSLTAVDAGSGVERIVYTTDGSAPMASSTRYSAPFQVTASTDVRFRAYDKVGNAEDARLQRIEVGEDDDDGDSLEAPPLDPTLPATVAASAEFLYTGPDAVQTGVAEGAIEARRTGILRGRVLAEDGSPLAGVTVTLLDHPELGRTVSRENGRYDLAVNGGGALVVDFHKDGFVDAQRTVEVGWQEYADVDDVALVAYDAKVTEVDLGSSEPIQTARGTTRTDRDGSRQATVMFRQGTKAHMQLPDGSQQELDTLHIRATEYTVGDHGDERMPAALPPTSGYTYAVELSADEAVAADADSIKFDKPVAFYLENFLDFNVGSAVPVGWYDRSRGVWVPEPNGRVVEIVGETDGRADINLDRDPGADPDRYEDFGLTDTEREEVAALYEPGQSLWRVQLSHFSPLDCNWLSRRLGPDADPDPEDPPQPEMPDPDRDDPDPDDDCKRSGSIIGCENRTLGEIVPVSGTPFSLHYESDRVPGRKSDRVLRIPVTTDQVPEGLKRVEVTVNVAGQETTRTFDATPGQSWLYEWDGKDGFGRGLSGSATSRVDITYVYAAYRQQAIDDAITEAEVARGELNLFAKMLSPTLYADLDKGIDDWISKTRERARVETEYTKSWWTSVSTDGEGRMGTWDARGAGLGGWTLDAHHTFDPASHLIYQGDGDRRSPVGIRQVLQSIAGDGECGDGGDGGPADEAQLCTPEKIAAAPDGSLYFTEGGKIRRIDGDGIITPYAGTGTCGVVPDGTNRRQANICLIEDLEVAADGSVYLTDREHVLRIDGGGAVTRVAGGGAEWADDGKATAVPLCGASGIAMSAQGGFYVVDRDAGVVRYVGTDGQISTVAGKNPEFCPVGTIAPRAAARAAAEEPKSPQDLTVAVDVAEGPDGSLYVPSAGFDKVYRRYPDGQVTHVAGRAFDADPPPTDKDGIPAVEAELALHGDLEVGSDGALYLNEEVNCCETRLRRVGPDGIVTTVAGRPPGVDGSESEADGQAATATDLEGFGFALAPDGSIALTSIEHRILRVASPLPGGLGDRPVSVPSGDGSEVWQFSPEGRHLRTYDALTGALKYQFGYDDAGLLTTVTDRHGNMTKIERGANGKPLAILAPGGQRTDLTLDANGYLSAIENPADEAVKATYTADGLMKSFAEPAGHTTTMQYDDQGRLRREEGPGGIKILESTDIPFGSRVTLRTGLGRAEVYEITEHPDGDTVRKQISKTGAVTSVEARRDGTLHSTYEDGTNVTLVAAPDPRWGVLAPAIEKLTVVTPGGRTKTTTEKRTASFTSDDPITGLATMTNEITVNGRTTTRKYDAATRTITDRTPEGREAGTTFNALGRVERWTPGSGLEPVTLTYDTRGRVTDTVQGTRTEHLEYDDRNRVTLSRNPLGKETHYEYDDADRLTKTTLPSGRVIEFGYDDNGNRTHVTMPSGKVHELASTDDDLVERYTPPGNGSYEWSYDGDRALEKLKLPSGRTVTAGYDAATGRVTGETTPEAQTAFTYEDGTQRVDTIQRTETGGGAEGLDFAYDSDTVTGLGMTGSAPGAYTFAYDDALRLESAKLVSGADTVTTALGRDDDGLLTQLGPFTLVRDLTGAVTDIKDASLLVKLGHDTLARANSRKYSVGGSEKYGAELTYDAAGRLETKTERVAGVTRTYEYTYDDDGQLREVSDASGTLERYEYDDNGNRKSRQVGSASAQVATYDDQDRLKQVGETAYTFDADGFLAARGQDTFRYGTGGELLGATVGGKEIKYANDGLGRRVARTVDGETTRYYYGDLGNPFQVTASRGPSGVLTTYYYDDAGALFAFQRGGARFYVGSDQVGTPRVVTNASGTVVKTLSYDSFGVPTADSDPSFELPIGFAGGLADPATGLVRFGYRDYDPATGRWTARDPVFYAGGQANLYVYVANNPLTFRDPTGLWCIEAVGYSGVGGGAKLCHSDEGTSLCLEVGFGLGGSLGLDSGDMELPGSEIEAELKAKCGPIGAGAKCKFDECGLNCKPKGEVGPFKIEKDKAGVNVKKLSGAKAVLEGTKCSLGGKLAGRVCRAWRNYG
jgi:RHS repeat-associated protein